MQNVRRTSILRGLLIWVAAAAPGFWGAYGSEEEGWQRFRGPNGTGISASKGVPVEFGAQRNLLWRTPLPAGHSSPVLGTDCIFVTGYEGERLFVIALDRKTGRIRWQRPVPRTQTNRLQKPNNPASPSAVTDGNNVYAFFQDFGLISFDAGGKERWRVPLGPFTISYGFGASPILVDDKVILPCDQDTTSFMIAVDRTTGKLAWKVDRPGVISGYSTPIVWQSGDGPKQIIMAESFQLSSYSAQSGRRLWYVRGLACEMKSVPSLAGDVVYINGWGWPENQPGKQIYLPPVDQILAANDADKDGMISQPEMPHERLRNDVYFRIFDIDQDGRLSVRELEICRAMMASENGLLAITLGGSGDMTGTAIRWRYQRPVPQVPSTLLVQGTLFMVNDSGVLISFDTSTGNVIKQGRLKGAIDKYFASPVASEGKIYLASQDGTVSVVRAAGDWEVLAVNALGEEVFATPAIAGGRLFIRTTQALHCYGEQK